MRLLIGLYWNINILDVLPAGYQALNADTLAMLELVKQGIIAVRQDRGFQDIEMENQYLGVPKY